MSFHRIRVTALNPKTPPVDRYRGCIVSPPERDRDDELAGWIARANARAAEAPPGVDAARQPLGPAGALFDADQFGGRRCGCGRSLDGCRSDAVFCSAACRARRWRNGDDGLDLDAERNR